jgi:hypothetical protein
LTLSVHHSALVRWCNFLLSESFQTKSMWFTQKLRFCDAITVGSYGTHFLIVVVMKSTMSWDVTSCSLLKVNDLPPIFIMVYCSAYSTVKMGTIYSFETTDYRTLCFRRLYSTIFNSSHLFCMSVLLWTASVV